jgi:hypothetical protein
MSRGQNNEAGADARFPKKKIDEFLKVAQALKTIRDKQLYRGQFASFDAYCRSRLGMAGGQVDLLIAFADVEVETRGTKPEQQ